METKKRNRSKLVESRLEFYVAKPKRMETKL